MGEGWSGDGDEVTKVGLDPDLSTHQLRNKVGKIPPCKALIGDAKIAEPGGLRGWMQRVEH